MLYQYKCAKCGLVERFVSVEERHNQHCECGLKLQKIIAAPVPHIWKPYFDELMDYPPPHIESRKQHKQEMEKRGLEQRN